MEEAALLNDIRKKRGLMLAVAPDTFLGASQQTARYIVDHGLIGQPLQAIVHLSRGYFMIKSDADDAVRKYSVMAEGGGIPYDMGGYYLHELFNILGSVKRVCGFAYTHDKVRPYLNPDHTKFNEDYTINTINTLSASLEFACGTLGTFSISSEYHSGREIFEIHGTEGSLYLGDPNGFGEKVYIQKGNGDRVEFPISHPFAENCRGIGAAEMAWSLRENRAPRLSFEIGYHALEVIEAVRECSIDGNVKTLTTSFERPRPISSEYYSGRSEERSLFL